MNQAYVEVLKNYVEVEFGQKIQSKPDCMKLSNELFLKTGQKVSYNTLRRLYGILPNSNAKPRVATLNVLSSYLGYENFSAFMLFPKDQSNSLRIHEHLTMANPSFEVWYATEILLNAKTSDDIVGLAFLLRTLLLEFRYAEVISIMQSKAFQAFSNQSREMLASLAELTGDYFLQIKNSDFLKKLIEETYYVKAILSFYVANGELNNSFGKHIQLVNQITQSTEQILFTSSLLAWNAAIYKNPETFNYHMNRIVTNLDDSIRYFPVLQGRIDLLFCIANNASSNFELTQQGLNELISYAQGNDEYVLLYCFDITSYLMLSRQLNSLQTWVEHFGRRLRKTFRWSDYSIAQQHIIAMCAVDLLKNEIATYKSNRARINSNLWSKATYSIKQQLLQILDELEAYYFSGGPMPAATLKPIN